MPRIAGKLLGRFRSWFPSFHRTREPSEIVATVWPSADKPAMWIELPVLGSVPVRLARRDCHSLMLWSDAAVKIVEPLRVLAIAWISPYARAGW
jgi:hypothetical protein